MLGGVKFNAVSNDRAAWLIAGMALVVTMALPSPAAAQVDVPATRDTGGSGQPRGMPVPPPAAKGGQGQGPSAPSSGRSIDLINIRDAIANTMVVAPAPSPEAPAVTALGGVVCVAGCDKANGSIVYHDSRMPMLASMTAPKSADPSELPSLVTTAARASAEQPGSPVTCLAGCYEPPPRRTVASLRATAMAKAAPVPSKAAPRRLVDSAPVAIAPLAAPVAETVTPQTTTTAEPAKSVKLRSAFSVNGKRPKVRKVGLKNRSRTAAYRPTSYGKTVPVPADKVKAVSQPVSEAPAAAPTVASADPAQPTTPAPVAAAPARKPEKKQAEKAKPLATVSNDWFNRINRERKAQEAAPPTE